MPVRRDSGAIGAMPDKRTANHVPPRSKRGASWNGVAMSIDVLLVECKGCNRRAALGKDDAPIYQGNMQSVAAAKFSCRKCGPVDVRSYIPISQDEIDFFLAGDRLPPARRVT